MSKGAQTSADTGTCQCCFKRAAAVGSDYCEPCDEFAAKVTAEGDDDGGIDDNDRAMSWSH